MFKDDRISPNSVALKSTIPSLVSGMFIVTRRCTKKMNKCSHDLVSKWCFKFQTTVIYFGFWIHNN